MAGEQYIERGPTGPESFRKIEGIVSVKYVQNVPFEQVFAGVKPQRRIELKFPELETQILPLMMEEEELKRRFDEKRVELCRRCPVCGVYLRAKDYTSEYRGRGEPDLGWEEAGITYIQCPEDESHYKSTDLPWLSDFVEKPVKDENWGQERERLYNEVERARNEWLEKIRETDTELDRLFQLPRVDWCSKLRVPKFEDNMWYDYDPDEDMFVPISTEEAAEIQRKFVRRELYEYIEYKRELESRKQ